MDDLDQIKVMGRWTKRLVGEMSADPFTDT
jgi:hypothetical protein